MSGKNRTEKSRSEKSRSDRHRSDRSRSDRSNRSDRSEISGVGGSSIPDDVETSYFIFIYEANGTYHSKLEDIEKTDGRLVVIHPVYYAGYNNNMNSEEIVYDGEKKKYVSKSTDGSWLDLISESPNFIYLMDNSNCIIHNDIHFHCDADLIEYLIGENLSSVDVSI